MLTKKPRNPVIFALLERQVIMANIERLYNQSVLKSFFQYLFPSLIGMSLLSVNIVVDGIFVGHGVGSAALAGVNVASPVYSIILSIALLIGIGGGTIYSIALGSGDKKKAQHIFTTSFIVVTFITVIVTVFSFIFIEEIGYFFGANEETISYVIEYVRIILVFSIFMAWESALSIFVRNDGNPFLAMISLVITSVLNIVLNYWMIFILHWGVTGAALATAISIIIGLIILSTHFLKKSCQLKLVKPQIHFKNISNIFSIGLPSFLSEVGMGVFVIGYNVAIVRFAATNGLAAFSVINYLHTFMFLAFMGIGSAIQPMISYYYGAKLLDKIKELIKLAEKTALLLGIVFFIGGFYGAPFLVSIFGITSDAITDLAVNGIRLFFISYLFMGINFIYITYFQSIGYVKPSMWLTVFRSFIVFIFMLIILPLAFGTNGVWLALPITEAVIMGVIVLFARRAVVGKHAVSVEINQ